MTRTIEVVPYNQDWPRLFCIEAEQIAAALAGEMTAIHHIGSTAIPGIKAKPILDFLVEVRSIEAVGAFDEQMVALGYVPRGENGIPGRRYFTKDTGQVRSHHVHVYQAGHPEIERHLDLRDYLRAHPQEAEAYSRLKEDLAEKFRHDSLGYTEGKTDFIREKNRRARAWREAGQESPSN